MSTGLTLGGWIFLIAAWSTIFSVTVYCFVRLLQSNDRAKAAAPDA